LDICTSEADSYPGSLAHVQPVARQFLLGAPSGRGWCGLAWAGHKDEILVTVPGSPVMCEPRESLAPPGEISAGRTSAEAPARR
jgi:hypothetical protein